MEPSEDDVNVTSEERWELLEQLNRERFPVFLPAVVLLGLVAVVGLVGNSLVAYVYGRKLRTGTTRCFVLSLALVDLFTCSIGVAAELAILRFNNNFDFDAVCRLASFSKGAFTIASAFIILFMTVERYRRLCWPTRRPLGERGARLSVALACLLGVLTAAPYLALAGTQTRPTRWPHVNATLCFAATSRHPPVLHQAYAGFLFLTFVACFIVLIVLYGRIALRVWRRRYILNSAGGGVSVNASGLSSGCCCCCWRRGKEDTVSCRSCCGAPVGCNPLCCLGERKACCSTDGRDSCDCRDAGGSAFSMKIRCLTRCCRAALGRSRARRSHADQGTSRDAAIPCRSSNGVLYSWPLPFAVYGRAGSSVEVTADTQLLSLPASGNLTTDGDSLHDATCASGSFWNNAEKSATDTQTGESGIQRALQSRDVNSDDSVHLTSLCCHGNAGELGHIWTSGITSPDTYRDHNGRRERTEVTAELSSSTETHLVPGGERALTSLSRSPSRDLDVEGHSTGVDLRPSIRGGDVRRKSRDADCTSLPPSNPQRSVSGGGPRSGRTTLIIVMIGLALILSNVPFLLAALARALIERKRDVFTLSEDQIYNFFLRSFFIQAAVNPIIYGFLNVTFRAECRKLLRATRRK